MLIHDICLFKTSNFHFFFVQSKNKTKIFHMYFKLREIFYTDNAMLHHSDLEDNVYEMNKEFDHPGSTDSDRNDGG